MAQAFELFSDRAEALMRAAIRDLPVGEYAFEDSLDNDGITDDPLTVALDLTVRGDGMVLDFSRSTAIAACCVALKHVLTALPANAGRLRPIALSSRTGRCWACTRPSRSRATRKPSCG